MNDQLGLFGAEPASAMFAPPALANGCRPSGYSLFFAVRPASENAARCGEYVTDLCRQHGSARAKPMSAKRLHVTLFEVAHFAGELQQSVLDAAKAAAAELHGGGPLKLDFDRLESFSKHAACVLVCTADTHQQVLALRDQLVTWMERRGVKPSSLSSPHMTAYYDQARVAGKQAVEPLSFAATHLSLLLSYKGCTAHELLGEWPL